MVAVATLNLLTACGPKEEAAAPSDPKSSSGAPKTDAGAPKLAGTITIDGSSTVGPISEAVAEEFLKVHADVQVPVGTSGTGGGMKKFLAKEIDIVDASRPISKEEIDEAAKSGLEFVELPVGFDGISIVVNKENKFASCLTLTELKKIWEPGSKINNWKDVRAGFPDLPLKLYGPGTESGTFEYFTEAVVGKKKESRKDYSASEDDNALVAGVAGDKGGLGYFGYAYFKENADKLTLIQVDAGTGCKSPTEETIRDNSYSPLSRPLFIYVSKAVVTKPEVQAFVKFYLTEGRKLISSVGYVPLPDTAYDLALQRFEKTVTGSAFSGGLKPGTKLEDVLKMEKTN
jgi:phosphate transport system substrate-binding protein